MEKINTLFIEWLQRMGVAESNAVFWHRVLVIAAILVVLFVVDKICKRVIIPAVRKVTSRTESLWDDYLLSTDVLKNVCRLVPPIVIYVLTPLAFYNEPEILEFIHKICWIYITVVSILLICTVISSLYAITSEHEKLKNHSLKGFYQMIKLVVVCIGTIIIISTLVDKNPIAILTGLGAGTAILMLVFQDTIKGLVAGIQLIANDMLRPGDWITVHKYGADGDVMEVTLTTVKVQNWDKTITTVPTYALINDSFQNWRGMFDIGGRRVKRSINIDMETVRFCTAEEFEVFKKEPWMEGFEATEGDQVNLHIFRHYMEHYLSHHPKVNRNMIMTVRQLQPTSQGIPVELYFFSANTAWLKYEELQGEVFDHVLARLHTFGLKVFQEPTGRDLRSLK